VEIIQPYLGYIGIGIGAVVGVLVLVWIVVSVSIFLKTKGMPQLISNFFIAISDGNINGAYEMTSDRFQAKMSKKQLTKFAINNKLTQYRRTQMTIPTSEEGVYNLEVVVETKTGRKIPLLLNLVKEEENWKIDDLEYAKVSKILAKESKS
jgi:hypothetical protein